MINLSILNGQALYWIDYSDRWAEVLKISNSDYTKIRNGLAEFDVKKKKVVDIPQPEPVEPTKEELQAQEEAKELAEREERIKETEALLLRKLALEELGEEDEGIETKLQKLKTPIEKPIEKPIWKI